MPPIIPCENPRVDSLAVASRSALPQACLIGTLVNASGVQFAESRLSRPPSQ